MRVAVFRDCMDESREPFVPLLSIRMAKLGVTVRNFTVSGLNHPLLQGYCLASDRLGRIRRQIFRLTRRSRALERQILEFGPDVILAHFAQDGWRVARLASRLGTPLVVVCHGSDVLAADDFARHGGLSSRQLAKNWGELIAEAAHWIVVSQHLHSALIARGVPEAKISLGYLGVEQWASERFGPPSSAEYSLGFFGRLEPNKGILPAVDALARVLGESGESASLLVVGDGSERAELLRHGGLVGTLTVASVGALPTWMIPEAMAKCRVVICPSVRMPSGVSEGFGLVSVEAQALGRPVVVFDTGGLAETVDHGRSGAVVPSGDFDGLARLALAITALNDDELDFFGREARNWVQSRFDADVLTRRYVQILREVIS